MGRESPTPWCAPAKTWELRYLGGLMHKNSVVRHCTQVTIEHAQNDEHWMLTDQGDDTPCQRIDALRHIAGLSPHAGNGTAPQAARTVTTKHAVVCLSYQLFPTCKALLGGVWGNQWVPTTNKWGIGQSRTDTHAITPRITMSDNTLCVDMTDLQTDRRPEVVVRGVTYTPAVPTTFMYCPPLLQPHGEDTRNLPPT